MPEDDPGEVERLLKYAVLGKEAAVKEFKQDVDDQQITDEFGPEVNLMKLYVLAHKLGYEEYQNALVDAMREYSDDVVMKRLSLSSSWAPTNLKRYVCRWHVHEITPKCRDNQEGEDSNDELTDLEDSK